MRRQHGGLLSGQFHRFSKAGWRYIEDDVDRYCPDKELIKGDAVAHIDRISAGYASQTVG